VGESLRRQRQHHLIDAGQAALPLLEELRLKGAGGVAGHPHLDWADVGQHGLGPGAIAAVAVVSPSRIVLVIADVVGDLALQGGLQHPLGQLLQQPVLAGQLQPLVPSPVNQHRNELFVRHRTRRCLNLLGLLVLHGGLRHQTHLLDHQIRR
jgi:hypothetical protein